MDKQMIKEMAKDMLDYGMEGYPTFDSVFTETKLREQIFHVFLGYAERLIKKGWTQIPENAVVLTDKKDIQQYEWSKTCDKMGIFKLIEKERAKSRKETAEKFAEKLKQLFPINEDIFSFSIPEQIQKAIDEICKEITEGKK